MRDRRAVAKHSRAALPVGTVRERWVSQARRGRFVKVREGRGGWMPWATWWWTVAQGKTVPAGHRVVHLNGDTLDDRPENIGVVTAGDVPAIYHLADPEMSRRNFAAMRRGTADHNRLRAAIAAATTIHPTRWYSVDFGAGRFSDLPHRKRWQAFAVLGVRVPPGSARLAPEAAVLGWPGLGRAAAGLLACYAAAGCAIRSRVAIRDVERLFAVRRWPLPARRSSWAQYRTELGKLGLARPVARGVWEATDLALETRGPTAPVTAALGEDLATIAGDLVRCDPDWRRRETESDPDVVRRLAAALARREQRSRQAS